MSSRAITLNRHIIQQEHRHPGARGELSQLLTQIAYAAKILAREIRRAALIGKLGLVGESNPTGDAQKKLDVFGNETMMEAFVESGLVSAIVSEELGQEQHLTCDLHARYVLSIDPLDGSSNTDINGPVGTIFGVFPRGPDELCGTVQQVLQPGTNLVAAGYVMYGPSTVLAYSAGEGVNGFTLDHDLGEFLLSHENIRCPQRGKYYSANLGHLQEWHPHLRRYIEHLNARHYSLRYAGALVADVHRSLMEGGLYFYPPDAGHPNGKLRLLYECAPLAYLVEQAGGRASDGARRIVEIAPTEVHQRSPLVIGSLEDVALYEQFLARGHE
jgi:fructose-1,6-bisphosphatase I